MSQTSKERIGQIGKKMARNIFPTDTSEPSGSENKGYYDDNTPDDKNNKDSVNILIKMLRFMSRVRKEEKEYSKIRRNELKTNTKLSEYRTNTLLDVFKTDNKKTKIPKTGGFSVLAAAGIVGVGLLASKDAFASIKVPDYGDLFTTGNDIYDKPDYSSLLDEKDIMRDFSKSLGTDPMSEFENELESQAEQESEKSVTEQVISKIFGSLLKTDEKEDPEKKSLVTKIMEGLGSLDEFLDLDSFNKQIENLWSIEPKEQAKNLDYNKPEITTPGTSTTISVSGEMGSMSQKYESGVEGSMAVGRDKSGGTSYGKYQIASKVGSMDQFLKVLQKNDIEAYGRLMSAGPQDAGVQGQFAQEWKKLAREGRIQKSEREYVVEKIVKPAISGLKDKDLSKMIGENKGLQEMMFSMAVQHGPGGAPYILNKVYRKGMTPEQLVEAAYTERSAEGGMRYFSKSSREERRSVVNRFVREKNDVRSLLGQSTSPKTGTKTTDLDTTKQQPEIGTIDKNTQKTSSIKSQTTFVQNNIRNDTTNTYVSRNDVQNLPVSLQLSRQIG
jgi:hypothetical protein